MLIFVIVYSLLIVQDVFQMCKPGRLNSYGKHLTNYTPDIGWNTVKTMGFIYRSSKKENLHMEREILSTDSWNVLPSAHTHSSLQTSVVSCTKRSTLCFQMYLCKSVNPPSPPPQKSTEKHLYKSWAVPLSSMELQQDTRGVKQLRSQLVIFATICAMKVLF